MICCNTKNELQNEEVDINKNSKENNNNNNKEAKLINKDLNKNKTFKPIHKNNLKKLKTQSKLSSGNLNKLKTKKDRRDSISNRDPNISLYNNTFQILNNTQQFISISNSNGLNFLKNNLINGNQGYKSYFNSKIDLKNSSFINLSKINNNNNLEDIFQIEVKKNLILSGELFSNKIIEIDKFGMKDSLRKKHDGTTIFGIKNESDNPDIPLYDYLLDIKLENNNRVHKKHKSGKVFEIILDKIEKIYVLLFNHSSLILYYKINDPLFFDSEKDYFLILGDIFLTINVKKSNNSNEKLLNIQVEVEDEKTKKYTYEQKDMPIKIGRINSQIDIPKPSISKIHGIFDFSNNMFFYNDMKSTNGSTLLIKEDDILKIKGEMNFKLDDISFQIKEIDNNS